MYRHEFCLCFNGAFVSTDPDQRCEVVRKSPPHARQNFRAKVLDKLVCGFINVFFCRHVASRDRFLDRRVLFESPTHAPYLTVAEHGSNQERYVRLARVAGSEEGGHGHDLDTATPYGPKILYADRCARIRRLRNLGLPTARAVRPGRRNLPARHGRHVACSLPRAAEKRSARRQDAARGHLCRRGAWRRAGKAST